MYDEIDWATPPKRTKVIPVPVKKVSCAVCNLRTDVLICKECAEDEHSLERVNLWLSKLGTDAAAQIERERLEKAKTLLRTL